MESSSLVVMPMSPSLFMIVTSRLDLRQAGLHLSRFGSLRNLALLREFLVLAYSLRLLLLALHVELSEVLAGDLQDADDDMGGITLGATESGGLGTGTSLQQRTLIVPFEQADRS